MKIFDRYYTTKQSSGGTGIGLALSKQIIEDNHNGRIYVSQSRINEGTTFRVELPRIKLIISCDSSN